MNGHYGLHSWKKKRRKISRKRGGRGGEEEEKRRNDTVGRPAMTKNLDNPPFSCYISTTWFLSLSIFLFHTSQL
uniref:Uncharacterized protein n=1 Tax=Bracon brevicornis TaxID=1563983 RepID=A0A6V7LUW9_9HYME